MACHVSTCVAHEECYIWGVGAVRRRKKENAGKKKGRGNERKEREEIKEREKEKKGREKQGEKESGVPAVKTSQTKK